MTAGDVEEWYQNPESFYHEQDSILWSERLRPCAEALYIVLFENNSQVGVFDVYFDLYPTIYMFVTDCVCLISVDVVARSSCGFNSSGGNERMSFFCY